MVARRGYTLTEALVSSFIVVALMGAMATVTLVTRTTLAVGEARIQTLEEARRLMDRLASELRMTHQSVPRITDRTGTPAYGEVYQARWGGRAIEFKIPLSIDSNNNTIWGAIDNNGAAQAGYKIKYFYEANQLKRRVLDADDNPSGADTVVARNLSGGTKDPSQSQDPNANNPIVFIGYSSINDADTCFDNPMRVAVKMNFEKFISGTSGKKTSLMLVSTVYMRE